VLVDEYGTCLFLKTGFFNIFTDAQVKIFENPESGMKYFINKALNFLDFAFRTSLFQTLKVLKKYAA
jgi:hypothetical protein